MNNALKILPFFLLGGVAMQASGVYLLLILLPVFALKKIGLGSRQQRALVFIAGALLMLWASYPLSNFYNSIGQVAEIPFTRLLRSHFSSSFVIVGLFLIFLSRRRHLLASKFARLELSATKSLFEDFVDGLVLASLVMVVVVFLQQYFGLDARFNRLPDRRLMGSLYRATGFYGHPMTLAAVSLALFSWSLSLRCLLPRLQRVSWIIWSQAYLIVASGSRAAFVLAFLALAGVVIVAKRGQLVAMLVRLRSMILGMLVAVVLSAGLWSRFAEIFSWQKFLQLDRLIFWRVHWQIFLEKPIWGHGLAQLDAGLRAHYYEIFGFADLVRKYAPHNVYLDVLASCGLVGAGMWTLAFAGLARGIFLLGWLQTPGLRPYTLALLSSLGVAALFGCVQSLFFDSSVIFIYLALGLILVWEGVRIELKKR